jgi:PAS domain S-box-containing protein
MMSEPRNGNIANGEQRLEEALRASELSYRRLFEAAQDGILILDVKTGRITDANPFLARLLGFSQAEMVGQTVGELSPFKDVVSNQAMLERLQKDGYVRYEDLPLETKDGRKVAVEFVSNVYEAGGQQVIQCNIRDITARKKAEQHLGLLHTCIANLNEIVMITEAGPAEEPGPRIVFVNQAFERITGYKSEETLGRSPRFLQGAKTDARVLEELHHAITQRQAIRRQVINYRKDGTEFWMDIELVPIFDKTGKCTHFIAIERDATAEIKSAELLDWKTALLEAQLNSSIDGIRVVDEQGKRILQNRRFGELWQIPQHVLDDPDDAAQIVFTAKQTSNPQQFSEQAARLCKHPEKSSHEVIELINGRTLDCHSAPVHDAFGNYFGRIWNYRDITEERKMESRVREAQKMESVGQLAGGIAHDFNNILSAIVGNLYLVKLDVAENPAILEHVENISNATRRATDLVNQILTFSRKSKQDRVPMVLNDVVLEALKLLRASLPASIRIKTELTKTPTVLANATAIHQIIMNLGTNAWQAMGGQTGELKVEMVVLEVDADFAQTHPDLHPGRYVQLSVSDTGSGMDRATLEHIFEPFFTTKAVGEGTGLGLAVVHGIMKSHDGGISVYSQPGEGTTFHLYFPAIETEAAVREIKATPILRGQGERVLFVDDEEVLAILGKKILEHLGYQVTMTTSALEALAAVRQQPEPFDLVVTDLTMPVMDGIQLGRELLRLQPSLPIIISTGYRGSMTAAKAEELGFRGVLSKPSTARALGEMVHHVLQPATVTKLRPQVTTSPSSGALSVTLEHAEFRKCRWVEHPISPVRPL